MTGMLRRYAIRAGLIDRPNARSSHSIPTPRGGGLAIVATSIAAIGLLYVLHLMLLRLFAALAVAVSRLHRRPPHTSSTGAAGVHVWAALGTLIPIVPEDQLLASRPDFLIVLPWHFRKYFEASAKLAGQHLVFPLSVLEVS
jgi:hypothetical protein